MTVFSPLIDKLVDAMRCLPGVGPRSAQRMVFHLLKQQRDQGLHLAEILQTALQKIDHCQKCRTYSENPLCSLCQSESRDADKLCIVETPADIVAIEQTSSFRGYYFVLMGHLSPIDGIGPSDLGIEFLQKRFAEEPIQEVIIATNPTVEGEVTAHYISELAKEHKIKTSRIAHGVPSGCEIEYIDSTTLARAMEQREELV